MKGNGDYEKEKEKKTEVVSGASAQKVVFLLSDPFAAGRAAPVDFCQKRGFRRHQWSASSHQRSRGASHHFKKRQGSVQADVGIFYSDLSRVRGTDVPVLPLSDTLEEI